MSTQEELKKLGIDWDQLSKERQERYTLPERMMQLKREGKIVEALEALNQTVIFMAESLLMAEAGIGELAEDKKDAIYKSLGRLTVMRIAWEVELAEAAGLLEDEEEAEPREKEQADQAEADQAG
ncbi:hypothetical protein FACS189487_05630 [Campylobacterota bacterium]|nr:hypothetical protein FACS189487_05630 [Campylobacterota bacterium]